LTSHTLKIRLLSHAIDSWRLFRSRGQACLSKDAGPLSAVAFSFPPEPPSHFPCILDVYGGIYCSPNPCRPPPFPFPPLDFARGVEYHSGGPPLAERLLPPKRTWAVAIFFLFNLVPCRSLRPNVPLPLSISPFLSISFFTPASG